MAVDCVKRREERYWLWIIFIFFPLGSVVYFFVFKIQDFGNFYRVNLGVMDSREIRKLENRLMVSDLTQVRIDLAHLYFKKKNWTQAEEHYKKVLERDETMLTARYKLAVCMAHQHQYKDAIENLKMVLEKDPKLDFGNAALTLAKCYEALGDDDKATLEYDNVMKNYSYGEARYRCGMLYDKKGNKEEAVKLMKEIIAHSKDIVSFNKRDEKKWVKGAKQYLSQNKI